MARIVILGAGLTGLSTAYHLEKRHFFDYAIFEKEADAGGLCRSVQQDGFTFDYTGHLLHASDPYVPQLLNNLVGMDQLNVIYRQSFIYSHNVYTRYPFQINLFGLPDDVIVDCIKEFAQKSTSSKKPRSFYDWAVATFGLGIARHFFFPFQEKIFSYNLKEVSPTWMGRFVPNTSLEQMIKGALRDNSDTKVGYNAQFFYPKEGGIQSWILALQKTLHNPVRTRYSVQSVSLKHKVVRFSNGHEEPFDLLVNTIPLDAFIKCLEEKPSTTFNRALNHLVCNSVVNFNLGINRPNLTQKHWIYFPETRYPFYRLGFPHNFATSMAPADCSSLYGEFSYIKQSNETVNSMLDQSLRAVKELFKLDTPDIITEKIITIPHAYVIYNFWREKNLSKLLTSLEQEHIYSIGRYGGWKYSSMQEAILDGKKMAETLTIIPATATEYARRPHHQEKIKETVQ